MTTLLNYNPDPVGQHGRAALPPPARPQRAHRQQRHHRLAPQRPRRVQRRHRRLQPAAQGRSVSRWQKWIPSFPWIAPGWRAWGRNPRMGSNFAIWQPCFHRPRPDSEYAEWNCIIAIEPHERTLNHSLRSDIDVTGPEEGRIGKIFGTGRKRWGSKRDDSSKNAEEL